VHSTLCFLLLPYYTSKVLINIKYEKISLKGLSKFEKNRDKFHNMMRTTIFLEMYLFPPPKSMNYHYLKKHVGAVGRKNDFGDRSIDSL
jgi:hypothetical protein